MELYRSKDNASRAQEALQEGGPLDVDTRVRLVCVCECVHVMCTYVECECLCVCLSCARILCICVRACVRAYRCSPLTQSQRSVKQDAPFMAWCDVGLCLPHVRVLCMMWSGPNN